MFINCGKDRNYSFLALEHTHINSILGISLAHFFGSNDTSHSKIQGSTVPEKYVVTEHSSNCKVLVYICIWRDSNMHISGALHLCI